MSLIVTLKSWNHCNGATRAASLTGWWAKRKGGWNTGERWWKIDFLQAALIKLTIERAPSVQWIKYSELNGDKGVAGEASSLWGMKTGVMKCCCRLLKWIYVRRRGSRNALAVSNFWIECVISCSLRFLCFLMLVYFITSSKSWKTKKQKKINSHELKENRCNIFALCWPESWLQDSRN